MNDKLTTEHVPRSIIDNVLLTALNKGDKVAILASKQDLDDLIAALCSVPAPDPESYQRRREMAHDFRELRKQAFA